jgi:hypothetical protein
MTLVEEYSSMAAKISQDIDIISTLQKNFFPCPA